ncbi:MAG: flagellar protein FlgN [Gammaproteobacteria bacterium]|nr:flagellar protein FlgN [Gammaproteobacteria bacterium]
MTALLSLLKNIQNHSQQLIDCLQQEKLALNNNQLDKLNEISSEKQVLLDQLNQLDKQRAASSANENFNDFITNSNNQPLIKQWALTRQTISECRHLNEVNGRIINKRSQINQDIISILSGRNEQPDETYNAKGNQSAQASLLGGIEA